MATYAQWLQKNGKTSSKANAAAWRKSQQPGQARQPRTPRARPAPFTYQAQIARDPLSIPFGSDLLWQGKKPPNLGSLGKRGFDYLTPVQRPGGGYAVFGLPEDPTPQWMKDMSGDITKRGQASQKFAQEQTAPWLASTLASLGAISGQAQTNYANLTGQFSHAVANAAAGAGVGSQFEGRESAPFQADQGLAANLAAGQAASDTAAAGYQGALANLQQGTLAQGLTSSLAQTIARMPDQWEQQEQQFMRSMAPILAQIDQGRQQGEWQRQQALEQRRQFNANNAVERQIAGLNADVDMAKINADAAADQADAAQAAAEEEFRSLAQIRGDLTKGQTLLDNQGRGFASRPQIARFHGKQVQWEQARNGKWYGVAGGGKGKAAGGGNRAEWVDTATSLWGKRTTSGATAEDVAAGLAGAVGDPIEGPMYQPQQLLQILIQRGVPRAIASNIVSQVTGERVRADPLPLGRGLGW